jgi:DNA-binding Lrp family transcriptional regulator
MPVVLKNILRILRKTSIKHRINNRVCLQKRHGGLNMVENVKPMEVERKFKIAKKDIALLRLLRENSRLTLTQISRKTKIPISTLYDRLRLLEKNKIVRHTTLVDFSKFGFTTKVHFLIKAPPAVRKPLQSFLQEHTCINSICETADEFQLFAEGIFENMSSAQQFKNLLENTFDTIESKTQFIVRNLKQEAFHIGS